MRTRLGLAAVAMLLLAGCAWPAGATARWRPAVVCSWSGLGVLCGLPSGTIECSRVAGAAAAQRAAARSLLRRLPAVARDVSPLDTARALGYVRADRTELCPAIACRKTRLARYEAILITNVWLTASIRTACAIDGAAGELQVALSADGSRTMAVARRRNGATSGGVIATRPSAPAAEYGHGMAMPRTEGLSAAERWGVAVAWLVSVLAPAVALGLALARRRGIDQLSARAACIVCLAGVASTHASDLPDHVDDARYMGALFCALIIDCCMVGAALAVMRRAAPAWRLAGVLFGHDDHGLCRKPLDRPAPDGRSRRPVDRARRHCVAGLRGSDRRAQRLRAPPPARAGRRPPVSAFTMRCDAHTPRPLRGCSMTAADAPGAVGVSFGVAVKGELADA